MNNFFLDMVLKRSRFKAVRELVGSVSSESDQKSKFSRSALLTLERAAASQSSSVACRSQGVSGNDVEHFVDSENLRLRLLAG
jgi:hypothetical protein